MPGGADLGFCDDLVVDAELDVTAGAWGGAKDAWPLAHSPSSAWRHGGVRVPAYPPTWPDYRYAAARQAVIGSPE
jgi:hypothetical protein